MNEGENKSNNIELKEEEKAMFEKFKSKNPEMTIEDWWNIRHNILKEHGAEDLATKKFLVLNGLILVDSKIPDRDTRKELRG